MPARASPAALGWENTPGYAGSCSPRTVVSAPGPLWTELLWTCPNRLGSGRWLGGARTLLGHPSCALQPAPVRAEGQWAVRYVCRSPGSQPRLQPRGGQGLRGQGDAVITAGWDQLSPTDVTGLLSAKAGNARFPPTASERALLCLPSRRGPCPLPRSSVAAGWLSGSR